MVGKVPGVQITGNNVIIRGVKTLYGNTEPLYLLDGIPISSSEVSGLNPADISTIEVLKGSDASIYGMRGTNGVIAFYTKRGKFMKRGVIEFGMLGYQKAREFYIPPYDSWNYKPTSYNVPRTLYWKPFLISDNAGTTMVKFKKKLNISKYSITIEGMTAAGGIVYFRKEVN